MKRIIYYLLFLTVTSPALAQSVDPMVTLPSPNTAGLGSMAETPISLFTGTPQINIPLYTITEGSLSLPVSLSYNPNAVKPDAHPGWVGLGWSLNAGGVITRKVRGMPDEFFWDEDLLILDSNPNVVNFTYPYGYMWHGENSQSGWSSTSNITTRAQAGWSDSGMPTGAGGYVDTEPDEFVYNFAGHSGTFFFDENRNLVSSNPAVKIEMEDTVMQIGYPLVRIFGLISTQGGTSIDGIVSEQEMKIRGFKITTPDGVQYEFGLWNRHQDLAHMPIEGSIDFFQEFYMGETWDSWYLVRITSPNETDVIDLEYNTSPNPIASFGKTLSFNKMAGQAQGSGIFRLFGPISSSSTSIMTRYSGKIIYPTYLSKITTRHHEVSFSTSETTEKEYDYQAILWDLFDQSRSTHRCNQISLFGNGFDAFWSFSGRLAISVPLPNQPVVLQSGGAFYDPSTKLGFFTRRDLPIPIGGLCSYTQNCGDQFQCLHEAEIIDFSRLKWRQLDKIEIRNKQNLKLKSFDLSFSSKSSQRLRLLSLREKGEQGAALPPYEFDYEDYGSNQYTSSTTKLPPYNSDKVDHWGYFNNTTATINTSASCLNNYNGCFKPSLNAYYNKRNTKTKYLYAGILNKIHYPTGGETKFMYEPHTYTKVVKRNTSNGNFSVANQSGTAGGLRIKEVQMKSNDGAPTIVRKYEYTDGILGGEIRYFWENYQGKLINGNNYTADRFVSESILPMSSNNSGTHIGYSKVVEKMTNKGRSEYYYRNHNDKLDENFINSIDPQKSPYSPFSDLSFKRGQLEEKRVYNQGNKLLLKELYTYYDNFSLVGQHAPAIATKQFEVLGGMAIEGTSYKLYHYPYNQRSKEVITYNQSGSGSVSSKTEYTHNADNFVSYMKTWDSNNDVLRTDYRYPKDITTNTSISSGSPEAIAISRMVARHMIGSPVETYRYRDSEIVGSELMTYRLFGNKILPYQEWRLQIDAPLPPSSFNTVFINPSNTLIKDADYTSTPIASYIAYDDYGNLREGAKAHDIHQSYVWGNKGTLPTAQVINAHQSEIAYTSFEEGGNIDEGTWKIKYNPNYPQGGGWSTAAGNQRTGNHGFNVSIAKSVEKTGLLPGTYTVSFWYKSGRFQVKVGSSTAAQTHTGGNHPSSMKYFEAKINVSSGQKVTIVSDTWVGVIDELRIYPSDAFMKTFAFSDERLQLLSVTDENNVSMHYEYDDLGREKYVRDDDKNLIEISSYHYRN